ncbi:MAG: FAD-binding dehydrogenase, partial [Dehalococcoidia bacterium]|nr:FAD-binding dehydrogenase [Dehalococcoidia bacterium]
MAGSRRLDAVYDVLVAGGGGSGLMAAIEAAEQRAKVLLVEKQPTLGGSTGMAIGSVTAAGTALQAAAGIQDSADGHLQDLLKCLPPGNRSEDYDLALSRLMVERAPQAIARLIELGVRFSGPHPEPPHTVYRMHNIVPDTTAAINTLGVAARSRGVTVQTET